MHPLNPQRQWLEQFEDRWHIVAKPAHGGIAPEGLHGPDESLEVKAAQASSQLNLNQNGYGVHWEQLDSK